MPTTGPRLDRRASVGDRSRQNTAKRCGVHIASGADEGHRLAGSVHLPAENGGQSSRPTGLEDELKTVERKRHRVRDLFIGDDKPAGKQRVIDRKGQFAGR